MALPLLLIGLGIFVARTPDEARAAPTLFSFGLLGMLALTVAAAIAGQRTGNTRMGCMVSVIFLIFALTMVSLSDRLVPGLSKAEDAAKAAAAAAARADRAAGKPDTTKPKDTAACADAKSRLEVLAYMVDKKRRGLSATSTVGEMEDFTRLTDEATAQAQLVARLCKDAK